jgi:hypothetical protein
MCDEVQRQLPGYVDRTLPRVRRRLVGLHLRRCPDCQRAFSAERDLAAGLRVLTAAPGDGAGPPPDGLLQDLLEQAAHPGVKGRAAVPARGAVSGARPVLSAALLVAGAAAGTGVGYAGWRGARRLRRRG